MEKTEAAKLLADQLRKAAEEMRSTRIEKKAAKELDPQRVLDFLRFFGGRK